MIPGQGIKYTVKRTDKDFYTLRQFLYNIYPYIMIPPLPKMNDQTKEDELEKRKEIY